LKTTLTSLGCLASASGAHRVAIGTLEVAEDDNDYRGVFRTEKGRPLDIDRHGKIQANGLNNLVFCAGQIDPVGDVGHL